MRSKRPPPAGRSTPTFSVSGQFKTGMNVLMFSGFPIANPLLALTITIPTGTHQEELMLRSRAAGLLISAFSCAFGTWMIVSGALGQARDARRSAASRAQGLAAWEQVHSVLTHARCINCHTATVYPQ